MGRSGKITIEAAAIDEYLAIVGQQELDPSRFAVSHSIRETNPARFHDLENDASSVSTTDYGDVANRPRS